MTRRGKQEGRRKEFRIISALITADGSLMIPRSTVRPFVLLVAARAEKD